MREVNSQKAICPWCAENDFEVKYSNDTGNHFVSCENCSYKGKIDWL